MVGVATATGAGNVTTLGFRTPIFFVLDVSTFGLKATEWERLITELVTGPSEELEAKAGLLTNRWKASRAE
jgi:hypothetical protein